MWVAAAWRELVGARDRLVGARAALAAVLGVMGPVEAAGIPEPIGEVNAARVLLHDLYEAVLVTGQAARYECLGEVTAAVFDRIVGGDHDAVALGRALAKAAAGGHLRVVSARPGEQRVLVRTGLGAGPAASRPERTFHLAIENRTATKLDYYVASELHQRVRVTRLGTAIVTATVTVENRAPTGAAPSYQLGPDGYFTRRPGEYWAWVLLWGPAAPPSSGRSPSRGCSWASRW